jgi:hypothetical protein
MCQLEITQVFGALGQPPKFLLNVCQAPLYISDTKNQLLFSFHLDLKPALSYSRQIQNRCAHRQSGKIGHTNDKLLSAEP